MQYDIFSSPKEPPLSQVIHFSPPPVDFMDLFEEAKHNVLKLFHAGWACSVSWSSGKDSSALLTVVVAAMMAAKKEGLAPSVLVLHGDTGIESPEVRRVADLEILKIKQYAKSAEIQLKVSVVKPEIPARFACKVIGGRSLPSYAGTNHDCTMDLKVTPMNDYRAQMFSSAADKSKIITLTGTRFSESQVRAARMRKNGDRHDTPTKNDQNEWIICPICLWSDDDVWELFGLVMSNMLPSYSSLSDVFALYRDAGPTNCAVINDSISEGKTKKGGCGTRFGCYTCLQVKEDSSLNTMIEKDPEKYGYMRGLAKFRSYLDAIQYDWDRRQMVCRTLSHGYIRIDTDVFNPIELRNLFRFAITLDARERINALRLGIKPRFEIISQEEMVYIDAYWALQGYWPAFTAWRDWLAINHHGDYGWDIPVINPYPKTESPEPRFLYVGGDWETPSKLGCFGRTLLSGNRDAMAEGFAESCYANRTMRETSYAGAIWEYGEDESFSIDAESLAMFEDFEIADKIQDQDEHGAYGMRNIAGGYIFYMNYGLLSMSRQQHLANDKALRRTRWKEFFGLAGPNIDHKWLIENSVAWTDVSATVLRSHLNVARIAKLKAALEQNNWEQSQTKLFS